MPGLLSRVLNRLGPGRDRVDKFTERAQRVLQHAQDEALRRGDRAIEPRHVLLGLLREPKGVAAGVLASVGIDASLVDRQLPAPEPPFSGPIGLTPECTRAIEAAVQEARRLDHHYIGTEHLLLGLLHVPDPLGVFASHGLSLDVARKRVRELLQ